MWFTYFFISFVAVMFVHRLCETFSKREKEKGKVFNRWTLYCLQVAHVLIIAGVVFEYFYLKPKINFYVTALGMFMFLFALIGRNWSIRTLGRYHSIHIEIRENHKLIKDGPYKYSRNPYYFCVIFEVMGLPLIANSYFVFLFALFVYVPLMGIRIYFEQKALEEKFTEEYLSYRREVPLLFPGFKKIRKELREGVNV